MRTTSEIAVERFANGTLSRATDWVAEEVPVALVYQGVPHVVMLASPSDLEDFAVGFTVSEGLVSNQGEIHDIQIEEGPAAIDVRIRIEASKFSALLAQRRNLTGRTGCGLCGVETVEQAMRPVGRVGPGLEIDTHDLHASLRELSAHQLINARTGSVHAAGWAVPGKGLQCVREDVGRHNALDKTIGALLRSGADLAAGYMLITSRASYEMVQKSASVGIALLAAVSAPTTLAIRIAEQSGLTLLGFARGTQHVVYAHPQRIRTMASVE